MKREKRETNSHSAQSPLQGPLSTWIEESLGRRPLSIWFQVLRTPLEEGLQTWPNERTLAPDEIAPQRLQASRTLALLHVRPTTSCPLAARASPLSLLLGSPAHVPCSNALKVLKTLRQLQQRKHFPDHSAKCSTLAGRALWLGGEEGEGEPPTEPWIGPAWATVA